MGYAAETLLAFKGFTETLDQFTGASARRAEQAEIRKEERTIVNNMATMAMQSMSKMPMQDQINFEQSGLLGYGMSTLGGFIDMPFQQSLAQRTYGNYLDSYETNTVPYLQDLASTRALLNYYSPDNPMVNVIDGKINSEMGKFQNTTMNYMDQSIRFSRVATEESQRFMPAISFQAKSDWEQTKSLQI